VRKQRQMLAMDPAAKLTMAAIGIVVGLAGAFAATRLLSGCSWVGATDLPTYFAVVLLIAVRRFSPPSCPPGAP